MAIFTATGNASPLEIGIDFVGGIDLNWYSTDSVGAAFYDNINASLFGYVYQDVIVLDADDGVDQGRLTFGGTGFVVGANSQVFAGTVTGLNEMDVGLNLTTFRFEQISISAVSLYNATLTASNADEMALLIGALGGNDTITLAGGRDRVFGMAGNDLIDGGTGNDTLAGDAGLDTLIGGLGDDSLTGGSEADDLRGMSGNDILLGEAGNDLLNAAGGHDTLDGGDGGDTMIGGSGNDSMVGGLGNDDLNGTGNNDTVRGGDGVDTLHGGLGLDDLYGDAGADVLYGDAGADTMAGGTGNDSLYGGNQADRLYGDDQSDLLVGGLSADIMTGGLGADTFVWNVNDFGTGLRTGTDRITDFDHTEGDRIDLSLIDASTTAAGNNAFTWIGTAAFTGVGGQLHVVISAGNTYIEGDRNGDAVADWAIRLDGVVGLAIGDFVL